MGVQHCNKLHMTPPTLRQFVRNMEQKMQDKDFLNDTKLLLRQDISYDPHEAYDVVRASLIDLLN